MLQLCRTGLKIKQKCRTLSLMLVKILCSLSLIARNWAFIVNKLQQKEMHFFWERFNLKIKKFNINDSASKAKSCQCSGKNLVY